MRSGPILIGYDGSQTADRAIRDAGDLLRGHSALVIVVAKAGLGFELMEVPTATLGLPLAPLDIQTAVEVDREIYEGAQRMAQHGASLAREAGFEAEGLAIADDVEVPVAETIVRLARERDAEAIVVGAHDHARPAEILLGSTAREVIRHADRPVVVGRGPEL